jgi:hypothetical protein
MQVRWWQKGEQSTCSRQKKKSQTQLADLANLGHPIEVAPAARAAPPAPLPHHNTIVAIVPPEHIPAQKAMVSQILPLVVVAVAMAAPCSLAFAPPPPSHHRSSAARGIAAAPRTAGGAIVIAPGSALRMLSSFFADATGSKWETVAAAADADDAVAAAVAPASGAKVQVDAGGRAFAPGRIVAVSSRTTSLPIRAYSAPKACHGSFDTVTGEFVPRDAGAPGPGFLVLPGGLRGVVERVYDTNEWDRARPIVVKFGKGRDGGGDWGVGGGFNVPAAFTMHFDADELDVLDG